MTFREEFIRDLMKRWKIGRARAEKVYREREARHGDFQWYKVGHIDLDDDETTKAPKSDED
jgi:hypothetical protein